MDLQKLKEKYIHAIYREGAFIIKEESFTLHHGGESHLYLNHNEFLSKFGNLKLLSELYETLLPKNIIDYKLGAVDSVMSPVLCGLMSADLKKDIVVTKEKKLEHGLEKKIYGKAAGEIVLIDDVTSTGAIIINAASVLREKGAIVRYALVSACRDMTGVDNLEKAGIRTFYVATFREIIAELWDTFTEKERNIVLQEVRKKQYDWKLPVH